MPYNPGVQSQAGQFYAQGIQTAGNALADGIKQYQQNKIMAGQGVAKFEATAKANPEILQFLTTPDAPVEAAKAYEKLKKDGTLNVRDAAFLAQFSDTFQQETQAKQQAQMRALQMKQMEAQVAQEQAQVQQAAKLQQLQQFSQGAGSGVYAPQVQQRMTKEAADPVMQFAMQTQAATGRAPTPNDIQQFLATNEASESRKEVARLRQKEAPPGAVVSAQQIQQWKKDGLDVDAVPMGDGRFMARKVSPFAPPPSTTVNLPASETSFGKEAGRMSAERQMQEYAGAQDAVKNLARIDQTLDVLNNGEPTTGIFAEAFNNMNRIRQTFMADKEAGKKVTDTQVLDSLMGSEVFPLISALGLGSKGMDTPAEREFLRKVMTGTIELNKDTLIRMAKTRRDIAESAIKTFNDKVEDGEYDKFFEATGIRKRTAGASTKQTGPTKVGRFVIEEVK